MTLAFTCPGCGHRFERPAELAGRRARCKYCRLEFRIPKPASASGRGESSPRPVQVSAPAVAESFPPPPASDDFEVLSEPAVLHPDRLDVPDVFPERIPIGSRFREPEPTPDGKASGKAKRAGKKSRGSWPALDRAITRKLVAGGLALLVAFLACKAAYRSIAIAMGWETPAEPSVADLPIRDDLVAQHGDSTKQIVHAWQTVADLYAGVKNFEDFEAATAKYGEVGQQLQKVAEQINKLPKLNAAEQKKLLDTYGPATEDALVRLHDELERIKRLPAMANADFTRMIQTITSTLNQVRAERAKYDEMFRESQYAEVVVTNLPTPEAEAIVSRKLGEAARRAAGGEVSRPEAAFDGNTRTLTAKYSPIPDPQKLADAIDFGKVSISGRTISVVADDIPEAELAAERKASSPSGKLAQAIEGLRSQDVPQQHEAIRLLEDVKRTEPQTLRDNAAAVATALTPMALGSDHSARDSAIRMLVELEAPEAVPPLLRALGSDNQEVRAGAARALEGLARDEKRRGLLEAHREAVVKGLVARMSDQDWGTRGASVNAFRALGWPELVPVLAVALGSPNVEARGEAVKLLMALGRDQKAMLASRKEDVLSAVAGLVDTGPHPYANDLMTLLGESGWPGAVPTLVVLLRSKDRPLRDAAFRRVFEIARTQPEQLDPHRAEVVLALREVLDDRDGGASDDVARFLAGSDWPEALPALLQSLPGPLPPEAREQFFQILGDLARSQPDRLTPHREAVLDALALVIGLEDGRSWGKMLEFLRDLRWPEAVPTFLLTLRAHDPELRRRAFESFRDTYRDSTEPDVERRSRIAAALTGMLGEPDRNLRGEVATFLLRFAGPDDVPALVEFLKGEDGSGRREVMDYLARSKDGRAAEAIAGWLARDAGAALGALRTMGPVAEEVTVEALASRDADVRRHAALALKDIGSRRSVRALQRAAQDPDGGVAGAAQEALQAIASRGGK